MPRLHLRPNRMSPRAARQYVTRFLAERDVDPLTIEDAALLATELVTNAVIHARTHITLDVDLQDGVVHVAVSDSDGAELQMRNPGEDDTTGRGLRVLDNVATAWEVVYGEQSKTVRFSLAAGSEVYGR